jgi:hypothetical protein
MAVANLGFGTAADRLGAPILFLGPGLAFTALIALTLFGGSTLRQIYREGAIKGLVPPLEAGAAAGR